MKSIHSEVGNRHTVPKCGRSERGWQPKSIADNLGGGIRMKSCGIYSHPHRKDSCAWIYKSRAVNLIWTWMSLVLHLSDFLNSRESRLGPICWDLIIGHKILILEQPPITCPYSNKATKWKAMATYSYVRKDKNNRVHAFPHIIFQPGKNCFKLSSCAQSMPGSSSSLSSCLHRAWAKDGGP